MSRSAKHMDALTLHCCSVPDNWAKHGDATGFDAGARARTLKAALGINTFQQPQAVAPAPYSAQPGPQGLVLELPPKSVVVGMQAITKPRPFITLATGGDTGRALSP